MEIKYTWLIAYIDSSHLKSVQSDLKKKHSYKNIEAYIPIIKVLKKKFKGKNIYDEIPMLFNYGFFKVPVIWAINESFCTSLKRDISCIYGWVQDPAKIYVGPKRGAINFDACIKYATLKQSQIDELKKTESSVSLYTAKDIGTLLPGNRITLQGYPFDNIDAEIVSVNTSKQSVRVRLLLGLDDDKIVEVSMDNIFYTIYKDYYEPQSHKSLNDLENKHSLDKIQYKQQITHE